MARLTKKEMEMLDEAIRYRIADARKQQYDAERAGCNTEIYDKVVDEYHALQNKIKQL